MRRQGTFHRRFAGAAVAALSVAALAVPATAQAASPAPTAASATAGDIGAAASWRTLATYRTSFTCQGEKTSLELSTPWVLRCQKAGTFTYHLQRYY
ncbi:hypothetical protein [Streptomyces sp. NPDC058373]|uniref:hypothetical protein n=1 Tax=unclassified Streptomyces TaxID=2593676 RepID=UPI0036543AA1